MSTKIDRKEVAIKARAQRIAAVVIMYRLREESLSDDEIKDLMKAVYEDQLKRLRAEDK